MTYQYSSYDHVCFPWITLCSPGALGASSRHPRSILRFRSELLAAIMEHVTLGRDKCVRWHVTMGQVSLCCVQNIQDVEDEWVVGWCAKTAAKMLCIFNTVGIGRYKWIFNSLGDASLTCCFDHWAECRNRLLGFVWSYRFPLHRKTGL